MNNSYAKSEEFLLWSFDKLFLFEFFLRDLRINRCKEYELLRILPDKIKESANQLQIFERLLSEERGIECEDLITLVLDYMQFGELPEHNFSGYGMTEDLSKKLIELCNRFRSNADLLLKCDVYKLSDLVNMNKIDELCYWWLGNMKVENRQELGLEGKFGFTGMTFDKYEGENNTTKSRKTLNAFEFNFNCPETFSYKKNNYKIIQSIDTQKSDSHKSGHISLNLSISIEEDAGDIDSILNEFKSMFFLYQSEYLLGKLLTGYLPPFRPTSKIDLDKIINEKRRKNKLVTKFEHIERNLIGLYCYDLHHFEGLTLNDAAKELASLFKDRMSNKDPEEHIIKVLYKGTKTNIKKIHDMLKADSTPKCNRP